MYVPKFPARKKSRGWKVRYGNQKAISLTSKKLVTIQFEGPMSYKLMRGGKLTSPTRTFTTMRGKRVITQLHLTEEGRHALYLALDAREKELEQERAEREWFKRVVGFTEEFVNAQETSPAKSNLADRIAGLFRKK